jgi:hypothetical protein
VPQPVVFATRCLRPQSHFGDKDRPSGSAHASKRCPGNELGGLNPFPFIHKVTGRGWPTPVLCSVLCCMLQDRKRTSISHTRALPPRGTRLFSCLAATGCRLCRHSH